MNPKKGPSFEKRGLASLLPGSKDNKQVFDI